MLRLLKADAGTRSIPVVMLTSSKIERDVARAYALGANSYVQKPVDFAEFQLVIQRLGYYWLSINERPTATALEEAKE